MDCIFCKIIEGKIPSNTIYENEEFKVILDAFPSNKGHILIMPKNHVQNIFEIDEEQAARLFKMATKIAKKIESLSFIDGLNILQNNNEIAGQTVNHFHMHLIPRFKGDNVNISWKTVAYAEGEAKKYKDEIAEKLQM